MTPKHPRWNEFCARPGGPEGCDFHEDEEGQVVWRCGDSLAKSRPILETMPGIDVAGSLAYFEAHGGYCDCEVLINVAASAGEEMS